MTLIRIKNMVCPRCVTAVEQLLVRQGYTPLRVNLGEAEVQETLDAGQMKAVDRQLHTLGFELIEDKQVAELERVRLSVVAWVRMKDARPKLSDYLQHQLHKDYSTLSKLFSSAKGITIERYGVLQRVEYAKELLSYGQKSVSEIAYMMGYSSPAHMSAQFKQVTGLSPSEFAKNLTAAKRFAIDSL